MLKLHPMELLEPRASVFLQYLHGVVHVGANFRPVELRDLVIHDFDVVLHLRCCAVFQSLLDSCCICVCDSDCVENVLELDW